MTCPKVSLLVLTWNEKDMLVNCLNSTRNINYPNYEVIVIDNGSTDGTSKMIREEFPNVQLVEIERNVGPTEGANFGIRHALKNMPDYIFFTTNDTILDRNILNELIKVAESDETIGIVGPTEYSMEYPDRIESAGGFIDWKHGSINHKKFINGLHEVDYLGFILIKHKLIEEIGLYNSKFFAYWEDTDLCTRAKKAGYKVLCVPKAKIWHKGSHTTKKSSGFCEYLITRNTFWFMKLHATRRDYLELLLYYMTFKFWFLSYIYLVNHGNRKEFFSFIRGVYDGISKGP